MYLPAIDFPNAFPGASLRSRLIPNSMPPARSRRLRHRHADHQSFPLHLPCAADFTARFGREAGPQIQANFTWSKSLDDTSTVIGAGWAAASGVTALAWPQDPLNTRAEKGPSTFDVKQVLTATIVQDLHAESAPFLNRLAPEVIRGWQLLTIATLTSGSPFTIYSGVQQTGAGSLGGDRPDQIGSPVLSTSRTVREDYFGRGAANASISSFRYRWPGRLPDPTAASSARSAETRSAVPRYTTSISL